VDCEAVLGVGSGVASDPPLFFLSAAPRWAEQMMSS
jgi:hypothetical protein